MRFANLVTQTGTNTGSGGDVTLPARSRLWIHIASTGNVDVRIKNPATGAYINVGSYTTSQFVDLPNATVPLAVFNANVTANGSGVQVDLQYTEHGER